MKRYAYSPPSGRNIEVEDHDAGAKPKKPGRPPRWLPGIVAASASCRWLRARSSSCCYLVVALAYRHQMQVPCLSVPNDELK